MKQLLLSLLIIAAASCKEEKQWYPIISRIPMPNYYRKITGYDSIEIVRDDSNKLHAHFCDNNQWEFEKFRKDTVFVHDTIYTSKNYGNVGIINQR